jgi:hypothetical protein
MLDVEFDASSSGRHPSRPPLHCPVLSCRCRQVGNIPAISRAILAKTNRSSIVFSCSCVLDSGMEHGFPLEHGGRQPFGRRPTLTCAHHANGRVNWQTTQAEARVDEAWIWYVLIVPYIELTVPIQVLHRGPKLVSRNTVALPCAWSPPTGFGASR